MQIHKYIVILVLNSASENRLPLAEYCYHIYSSLLIHNNIQSRSFIMPGLMDHTYNPSTCEAEAVGSLEFYASQGYIVRPYL